MLATTNGKPQTSQSRTIAIPLRAKGSSMSDSANPNAADPNAIAQALAMTQQSLAALQRMQEQTAALHKQFLESQETAQRTLHTLVEQQQTLLLSGFGTGMPVPVVTVPAPVPVLPPVVAAPRVSPPPAIPAAPSRVVSPPAPRVPAPAPVPVPAPATTQLPVTTPRPQPAPVAKATVPNEKVASTLLAVVSEKTGYPVESLDLSMSLDGDLGVDSIKRVEILSTLQERLPDAPVVKPEHLGTLHTLKDVADFLSAGTATRSRTPAPVAAPAPRPKPPEPDDVVAQTMQVNRDQLRLLKTIEDTPGDIPSTLLAVVSEKTGYPVESLDLSMSLDGDLGVDSIKRVEILSTLQERLPDAPVVKPEHLGTLHTLKDVAEFLAGVQGPATTKIPMIDVHASLISSPVTPQVQVEAVTDPPAPDTVQLSGHQPPKVTDSALKAPIVPGKGSGGIPRPAPRQTQETARQTGGTFGTERIDRSILQVVDLDLTGPRTRLPLPQGAEFWLVGDAEPLTTVLAEILAECGYRTETFGWADANLAKPPAKNLAGLVLLAPVAPGPDSGLNRQAFDWLKLAAAKLRQTGRVGAAVFATIARFDGAFGLTDLSPEADPTAGGLAGIAKTAKHEWPEVNCKAIDLAANFDDPHAAAAAVIDEVLSSGPTEVGITSTHRCTIEMARTARRQNTQLINLGSRDVILVTGGARGVTAEVSSALAETYCPTLILTGRTPPPTAEPAYLAGLKTEPEMKKAIAEALGSAGNPRAVGDAYQKVVSQREIRRTLERIQQAGARVAYFPVDITDERAVADLLHQTRVKFGPISAIVHGAGVLNDKRIEDLAGEGFDHVYATKVNGLRIILDLLAHEDLKAIVLFSSTTARFGRVGQLAYACANEVLNKTAQVEARRRGATRVVAINWGPWDGGMVTPALRKMFENENVGVIPLHEGAMFLIQELNAAGRSVEVVALAKPPARSAAAPTPTPSTGSSLSGTTPAPASALPAAPVMSPPNPLPSADMSVAFERVVDIATHSVLRSHVLDGLAVLPVALHLEWLAHAALHGNPGLQFHGFNDLRVTSGVKVENGAQIVLRALAGKATKQDKTFIVPVELRGKKKDGRDVICSRAEIVLASALPKPPPADAPPAVSPVSYDVPRAYRELLFHGQDLQGIAEIVGRGERAFVGAAYPAPPPADWFEFPLRSSWVAEPLVLDSAFQMMILWTQSEHNTGSLPSFVGRYRQFRKSYPADPITVVIRVTRDDARFARADIDFVAPDGQIVAQIQDYECVMEPTLNESFRKNQLALK
jgi:NAD(P)-dependent dehydrogenase (short-subunit alcohol dehydrogenase family)/acyl carrier protein